MEVLGSEFDDSRGSISEILVTTLRSMQSFKPSDVSIVKAIYVNSRISNHATGVDNELLDTFLQAIHRTEEIYKESLSFVDLLDLYLELLTASTGSNIFIESRDAVGVYLLLRMRSGERIPLSFPMTEFLDAFTVDLDADLLERIGAWCLHKVKVSLKSRVTLDSSHPLISELLAVHAAHEINKIPPSRDFVESVRLFIS